MYCKNCGTKIKQNDIYCKNCGTKIIIEQEKKPINNTPKENSDLPLIIGIISIPGAFIFNILIIPLAIFGIILGINKKKKSAIILSILSIIISLLILLSIIFIMTTIYNDYKPKLPTNDYSNNYKDVIPDDNEDNDNIKNDLNGTWYLYNNNVLNNNIYYEFQSANTFKYTNNEDTYTGTYKIEKETLSIYSYKKTYKLTLSPISLIKKDGTIITNNLDDFEYEINITKDTMNVNDINENSSFILRKSNLGKNEF